MSVNEQLYAEIHFKDDRWPRQYVRSVRRYDDGVYVSEAGRLSANANRVPVEVRVTDQDGNILYRDWSEPAKPWWRRLLTYLTPDNKTSNTPAYWIVLSLLAFVSALLAFSLTARLLGPR